MKVRDGLSSEQDAFRQGFLFLLIGLLPLLLVYPVLAGSSQFSLPVLILFLSFLLVTGVWVMRGARHRFLLSGILCLVSLELLWVSIWAAAPQLLIIGQFCVLLFLILLLGWSVAAFLRFESVVSDLFIAMAVLYLLSGTVLGFSLFLFDSSTTAVQTGPGGSLLASGLFSGIAILTLQGGSISGQDPLTRVIIMLGMLWGILLLVMSISRITLIMLKKG
ncbi:MAG TPA: hypothetical protein VN372_13015 [Methanospirillum sp.]|nr:hypothetical protein [Methanospirillum sp.]